MKFKPHDTIFFLHSGLVAKNQAALFRWLAGDNDSRYLAIEKQAELKCEELAGTNPSPLERMLVDRIVTCWLQVQMGDKVCFETDDLTFKQVQHREQVRDRCGTPGRSRCDP